jgi:hypothetical protein
LNVLLVVVDFFRLASPITSDERGEAPAQIVSRLRLDRLNRLGMMVQLNRLARRDRLELLDTMDDGQFTNNQYLPIVESWAEWKDL